MKIDIIFLAKKYGSYKGFQEEINFENVHGTIYREANSCEISLCISGNNDDVIRVFRLVWELSFLYVGYFYSILKYEVDGVPHKMSELLLPSFYKTGKIWKLCAQPLVDNMDFSAERLEGYSQFRNASRDSGSMNKTLVNGFYYLHSESYERININHRLSLLLNICDGVAINFFGMDKNLEAKISKVLKDTIGSRPIKYGASLLGIPSSSLFTALMQERDEIDHYVYKSKSITSYILKIPDKRADYVNMYFCYIVELALRIAFMKQIGVTCPDEKITFSVNEINDWIILKCELPELCKNPENQLRQKLSKAGIEFE